MAPRSRRAVPQQRGLVIGRPAGANPQPRPPDGAVSAKNSLATSTPPRRAPARRCPALRRCHRPCHTLVAAAGACPLHNCSFCSVSLVSKRFHTLCSGPELLQKLDVVGGDTLPRAQALLAWLPQHAAHVRELTLGISRPRNMNAGAFSELSVAVSSCLAGVGAVGKLKELVVSDHTPLPNTAWLPTMRCCKKRTWGRMGGRCASQPVPTWQQACISCS